MSDPKIRHTIAEAPQEIFFTDDRPDNVAYIVNDSETRLILAGGPEQQVRLREVADRLAGVKRVVCAKPVEGAADPRVVALADWMPREAPSTPPVKVAGATLATIVYTSGTTGKPKGVMLSHENILQNVKSALAVYDVYAEDLFLSFLPLSHMLERMAGCYLTMVAGSQVAFARSIPQLAEDFKTVRPTVIVSVPRIFERLHAAVHGQLEGASPTKRRLFDRDDKASIVNDAVITMTVANAVIAGNRNRLAFRKVRLPANIICISRSRMPGSQVTAVRKITSVASLPTT